MGGGTLIFLVDIVFYEQNLGDSFIKNAVDTRIYKESGFYSLSDEYEIIYRFCAYNSANGSNNKHDIRSLVRAMTARKCSRTTHNNDRSDQRNTKKKYHADWIKEHISSLNLDLLEKYYPHCEIPAEILKLSTLTKVGVNTETVSEQNFTKVC